jgi:hypothetical protein
MQSPSTGSGAVADQQLLDFIGGEPLDGSGFEAENPDPEFTANDIQDLWTAEV